MKESKEQKKYERHELTTDLVMDKDSKKSEATKKKLTIDTHFNTVTKSPCTYNGKSIIFMKIEAASKDKIQFKSVFEMNNFDSKNIFLNNYFADVLKEKRKPKTLKIDSNIVHKELLINKLKSMEEEEKKMKNNIKLKDKEFLFKKILNNLKDVDQKTSYENINNNRSNSKCLDNRNKDLTTFANNSKSHFNTQLRSKSNMISNPFLNNKLDDSRDKFPQIENRKELLKKVKRPIKLQDLELFKRYKSDKTTEPNYKFNEIHGNDISLFSKSSSISLEYENISNREIYVDSKDKCNRGTTESQKLIYLLKLID